MPRFGTVKRQYPRVEVLRGYNPNEPFTLSAAYPVADGVDILSGQVVSRHWNSAKGIYEWVKGWVTPEVPYIAINDWVNGVGAGLGSDADVMEAGKLPALSCAGQFEIQTAFWSDGAGAVQDATAGANFVAGAAVQPDGVTGCIKVGSTAGTPIIGYLTRNHGPLYLGPTGSGNNGVNSSAVAANLYVVSFDTAYDRNPA